MAETDAVFQRAIVKMLVEVFEGPPGGEAYVLNPGDPGLVTLLETIDAGEASRRPMAGKTTIAAHADHVRFGLAILNRWAAGDASAWEGVDWNESWQRNSLTEEQWRSVRDDLRREAEKWRSVVSGKEDWDDLSASVALSTAAHTAYHLGAIRQILAAVKG